VFNPFLSDPLPKQEPETQVSSQVDTLVEISQTVEEQKSPTSQLPVLPETTVFSDESMRSFHAVSGLLKENISDSSHGKDAIAE